MSDHFKATLTNLTKTKWPILVALGVGGQAIAMLLLSWGNEQAVFLFCRKEDERDRYFEQLEQQEKQITRRRSDATIFEKGAGEEGCRH